MFLHTDVWEEETLLPLFRLVSTVNEVTHRDANDACTGVHASFLRFLLVLRAGPVVETIGRLEHTIRLHRFK